MRRCASNSGYGYLGSLCNRIVDAIFFLFCIIFDLFFFNEYFVSLCYQLVEALSLKFWSNVWILYSFFDESYADPKVHIRTHARSLARSLARTHARTLAHSCMHKRRTKMFACITPTTLPPSPPPPLTLLRPTRSLGTLIMYYRYQILFNNNNKECKNTRSQSYGFWIDSGNAFSTIIPGILFALGSCARVCTWGKWGG